MSQAHSIAGAVLLATLAAASEGACRPPQAAPTVAPGEIAPGEVAPTVAPGELAPGESSPRKTNPPKGNPPKPAVVGSQVVATELEGEQLVALPEDRLLLWSPRGRARVRSSEGAWSELGLPLERVREVHATGSELLILGHDPLAQAPAISRLNAEGKEIRRWRLPEQAQFCAALEPAALQITIGSATTDLRVDGTLGPPRELGADVAHASGFGGPCWVALAGGSIVCHGANLSMASAGPGHCRRLGAGGWEFEGPFVERPLACGAWLIASSASDGKAIEVRDQATGRAQGRARLSTLPQLACAGPDTILVGTRALELRRLPSLDVSWRQPVGKGSVRQLVVGQSFLAYVLSDSWDVQRLPKPSAAAP